MNRTCRSKNSLLWGFIILIPAISGCTRFHAIKHSQYTYIHLNRELRGREGYMALNDGQQIGASHIRVSVDSTTWIEPETKDLYVVSTPEIDEIVIPNGAKGRFQRIGMGMLGGAFGGGFGGLIIGATFTNKTDGVGYYPKAGAIYGSMAGGLFGLVYEVTGGTTHKYILKTEPENRTAKSGSSGTNSGRWVGMESPK